VTTASLLAYAIALALAVATPGPAMIALIGRSVARGPKAGIRMALGIGLADVTLGALALLGLAALLRSYAWALDVLKYSAAAYLVWLGVKMWRSPPAEPAESNPATGSDVATGLAVGLSNPKAMLFHASLMPLIIDLRLLDWSSAIAILCIIFAANWSVMSAYALAAGEGGRRIRSPQRLRLLGRLAGGAMVGAAALLIARRS
jgi:threonine/homoserine/homoserine lactone efflux protein